MKLKPLSILIALIVIVGVIGGVIINTHVFESIHRTQAFKTQKQSTQAMTGQVTNQWYSSLFFTDWSDPMFAFPLAYKLSPKGVGISYPQVRATEKTVFGSYTEDILVSADQDFVKKTVLTPDPSSVGVELCTKTQACLSTRFTHGSPVTVFSANQAVTLNVTAPSQTASSVKDNVWTMEFLHGKYILAVKLKHGEFVNLSSIAQQQDKTVVVQLAQGDQLFIALIPDHGTLTTTQLGGAITGTEFHFHQLKNISTSSLQAELDYLSDQAHYPSLLALLPHQWQSRTDQPIGTYTTLRGQMKLYQLDHIETTLTEPQPLTIPAMVSGLSEDEKRILTQVLDDTVKEATTSTAPTGVYENGKYVFKLAQLLEISKAVHSPASAQFHEKLATVLTQWLGSAPGTTGSPFLFSQSPKGVIARPSATQFGNEVFNDHHFHYGYYLAATGILLDSSDEGTRAQLLNILQPGLDPLVSDIANLDPANGYPLLRNFDPYESHSWADGHGTTGDDNNQESTSEAVNRWYGIYRLGLATKNDQLTLLGKTGLAMEQQAAQIYWLGQKPELYSFPTGYTFPMASLIWGGKLDFATWFSDHPSNIYGIQFLPLSPAMTHIISPQTWQKYTNYGLSDDPRAWNDLYSMVAVANGQKQVNGQPIPQQLKKYEGGNSAAYYYLWVTYWLKK